MAEQQEQHHATAVATAMNWSPYDGGVQVKMEPSSGLGASADHFDMTAFIVAHQGQQQQQQQIEHHHQQQQQQQQHHHQQLHQFYPEAMHGSSLYNNMSLFNKVEQQQQQQLREHLQRQQQTQQAQYYPQTQHQLRQPTTPYVPTNFNPLTPPGYSNAAVFAAVQKLQSHQQQQNHNSQIAHFDDKHDQQPCKIQQNPTTPIQSVARQSRTNNMSPLILTPNTTPPRNLDNATPSTAGDGTPATSLNTKNQPTDSTSSEQLDKGSTHTHHHHNHQQQQHQHSPSTGNGNTAAESPSPSSCTQIVATPRTPTTAAATPVAITSASLGSPVSSETSKTSNKNFEDDIFKPLFNAKGIPKKHKCKSCDFATIIKAELWSHRTQHMNAEKILRCPQCPFVTEYKHHLDFHVGNHIGAKPYHCELCTYRCVNKSMLKSHMKSHSDVHDYKCADCPYVAKYCHSMKTHLRNRQHRPAQELNDDGVPKAFIDVYGSRRGPKARRESGGGSLAGGSPKKARRTRVKRELMPAGTVVAAAAPTAEQSTAQMPVAVEQPGNIPTTMWTDPQHAYLRECLQQQQRNHEHQRHMQPPFEAEQQAAMRNMLLLLAKLKHGMILPPVPETDMSVDESSSEANYGQEDDDDDDDDNDGDDDPPHNNGHNGCNGNGLDLSVTHNANEMSVVGTMAPPMQTSASDTPKMSTVHRRKGRAFKLNDIATTADGYQSPLIMPSIADTDDEDDDDDRNDGIVDTKSNIPLFCNGSQMTANATTSPASSSNQAAAPPKAKTTATTSICQTNGSPATVFDRSTSMSPLPMPPLLYGAECRHCGIHFCDAVIHRLHMSYHSFNEPFTCNVCGMKCTDRVHFNMHIATDAH